MFEWWYWGTILAVAGLALSIAVTIHAVLNKRDNRAVIGWVGLAWLSPFVGSLAYWVLGINRIRRKASALRQQTEGFDPQQIYAEDDLRQAREFADRHPNLIGLEQAAGI